MSTAPQNYNVHITNLRFQVWIFRLLRNVQEKIYLRNFRNRMTQLISYPSEKEEHNQLVIGIIKVFSSIQKLIIKQFSVIYE